MTNRQLAAQQTRKKLVAAARRLIGEKGLTNTSVAEIAKEAGVANGTFYTYFRTKEEIVFELGWESFRNLLDETLQQAGGFPERLVYFMVHFAGQIEASGLKLCQEWVRNNADPALVEPQNRGKLQLDLASLGKLVEDGIRRGELKQDTPADMLARTLADVLYGQMLCWAMAGGTYSYKARTEEFCRFCLPALINPYLVKKKERNN